MSRLAQIAAVLGVALVAAGVAFIYWPAGLIVAGIALVSAALSNFKE